MSILSILSGDETSATLDLEKAPDAISYLEAQHREVESLFKQLEETGDRAYKAREQLFAEIAQKLNHHAQIEEKLFYPEGRSVDEELTLESYEEHEVMKHMIKRIQRIDSRDETFMAKVNVLKEIVKHHVREEEREYFPKCKKEFSSEERHELGQSIKTLYDRLESQSSQRSSRRVQ